MEYFCMMTAMLALLGPIAVGRVRCIRITPRLFALLSYVLPTAAERARSNRLTPHLFALVSVFFSTAARCGGNHRADRLVSQPGVISQRSFFTLAGLARLAAPWSRITL